jgi:hypothetical protein
MNKNSRVFPAEMFSEAWTNILLFSEHTWGAHNSVIAPDLDFVKNIWNKKRSYIIEGNDLVNDLLKGFATPQINADFKVINTIAFVQDQLVKLSPEQSRNVNIIVDAKGNNIASQRLSTGELVFVAREVLPFSSARYTLRKGYNNTISTLKHTENEIENNFYKISINRKTGNISSIYSKILAREMVNKNDSLQFNQFVYLLGKNHDIDEYRENNYYLTNEFHKKDIVSFSSNPRIKIKEAGDVIVTIEVEFDAPSCKTLISEISLVDGIDKINITNTMDKLAVRDKEAVHFSFPFLVSDPNVTYDIPTSFARVNTDQIPGSNKNWYTVQRWIDISNNDFGVVLSSKDASMFELKTVTANLYGSQSNSPLWIKESPNTSTVLSWALNNHWFTNYKADQEGIIKFQYDFAAHKGYNVAKANQFGVSNSQTLIVTSVDNPCHDIPFSLDNEQVYISHIKPSLDGKAFILSVSNMGDTDVQSKLEGLSSSSKIYITNLNEEKVKECSDLLSIAGRSFTLLRIE